MNMYSVNSMDLSTNINRMGLPKDEIYQLGYNVVITPNFVRIVHPESSPSDMLKQFAGVSRLAPHNNGGPEKPADIGEVVQFHIPNTNNGHRVQATLKNDYPFETYDGFGNLVTTAAGCLDLVVVVDKGSEPDRATLGILQEHLKHFGYSVLGRDDKNAAINHDSFL